MKKQKCIRCINDTTVKNISFDEEGVCNYCRAYDSVAPALHNYAELSRLFSERIERASQKRYDYVAAVGLSGGKDSVYVLYKLVKEYGLKVKAFTLDNGFLSEEACRKIDAVVKSLNVEHEYVRFDDALRNKAFRYFTKKFLSPCIACSFLGYAAMIDYAAKINAGMCVHGRSIPQMLRYYQPDGSDIFVRYVEAGLRPAGEIDLDGLYQSVLSDTSRYVNRRLTAEIRQNCMQNAQQYGYREFVPYFLYHPYDVKEVVEFITQNTPWRKEKEIEHFDCTIHLAAQYLKNIVARRAHGMPELSVSVRENTLSVSEALAACEGDMIDCPDGELNELCGRLKISKRGLLLKAKLYGKRWW